MLQNEHRKKILQETYKSPIRYNDLIEITGLKPGSLYHHLNILTELVQNYRN